jgi:ankyrin repeat protein
MLRAISTNDLEEVVQLLDGGFPIEGTVDQKHGYNALQLAAMTNHFPLIEMLVLRGADINKRDKWGNSGLMIAVANQNHEAIHSLLRNGCDLSIKNNYGMNAFDKASSTPSIQQFLTNFN